MAYASANGIRICYERTGSGRPVLMIIGSAAGGQVWTMHQTPALNAAGYETVVFDNRGIAPTDAPPGRYTFAQMVADTEGLIEALRLGPCSIVGSSLGAMIAQELAARRPELVRSAVLIGTRARADAFRRAHVLGERALADKGLALPAAYDAATWATQMFSPATLNDDAAVSMWLELFELSGGRGDPGGGQTWVDVLADRREALAAITAPCRVIAYTDDLVSPPHLGREVAEAIPRCDLVEIDRCGHLGFLERPEQTNTAILEFLDRH
jgi:pimeloyl-ACP methyl ester carboxylesterase